MTIEMNQNSALLILSAECTIVDVEKDTDRLKSLIKTHPAIIEMKAEAVKEIDTAYLQLLISLAITSDLLGIQFSVSGKPDVMRNICTLYGEQIQAQ
ncbi:MAG: hypothetical protein AAGU11_09930 [Syntrophobacteraceae bacterium]